MSDATDRVVGQDALLDLDAATQEQLSQAVLAAADEAVETIMVEVPGYAGALTGTMGQNIRRAVQLALANFLSMATRGGVGDASVPIAKSTAAAYDLGRGEARSGRSVDALLAAYRIGARVSWRHFSEVAVACDVPARTVGRFAELVFAYIDELSAASVAGHGDEMATTGRVRERYLERLARRLLVGEDGAALEAAAEQAAWEPPETLTAVLLPQHHAPAVLSHLGPNTLHVSGELPGVEADELSVLLVPDSLGPDRVRLLRLLDQRRAVLGPARPWVEVRSSYERALRARGAATHPRRAGHRDAAGRAGAHGRPSGARRPEGGRAGAARRRSSRGRGRAWRRRCGRGCCTTAGATRWPQSCTCTRRRSGTGWGRSARRSATCSTTPPRCWT